jgi:hypothetical protein
MAGFHHLNVSAATLRNQYATLGQVQDGSGNRLTGVAGVDNVTGVLTGGATSYTPGALISFQTVSTNTGAMTLSYNGIGPKGLVNANGTPTLTAFSSEYSAQ